jgi:magnesium-transporting ATPase (P-type)
MIRKPLWHAMSRDAVLKQLETDPLNGLTPDEAIKRLERVGPNELKHEAAVSPITIFIHQFKNILIVILIVAVVLSALSFSAPYSDSSRSIVPKGPSRRSRRCWHRL